MVATADTILLHLALNQEKFSKEARSWQAATVMNKPNLNMHKSRCVWRWANVFMWATFGTEEVKRLTR
uniref:Uncharacterized protein n=1 Tax=Oryza meridionalis TaxID=40149 RepID=A0A0E0D1S2_9ORYZ